MMSLIRGKFRHYQRSMEKRVVKKDYLLLAINYFRYKAS